MPKQKTHSGIKDRFKVTKSKKIMARKSHRNHNLSKKSGSRKRTFNKFNTLSGKFGKNIRKRL